MKLDWQTVDGPSVQPVSFEEAATFVRLADEADNGLLQGLIEAATEHVEGQTRRSFATRTIEATCYDWPPYGVHVGRRLPGYRSELQRTALRQIGGSELRLPEAIPLHKVLSVKYLDATGVLQTLPKEQIRAWTQRLPGEVQFLGDLPDLGESETPDRVRIRYEVGYGDESQIPRRAKTAILLLVAHLYENREAVDVGVGRTVASVPHGFEALLNGMHVPRV